LYHPADLTLYDGILGSRFKSLAAAIRDRVMLSIAVSSGLPHGEVE
jgi:hypothetical protein